MAIDSIIAAASARVAGAIRDAARSTGASFEYLVTAARIESNLNPSAQAPTSSAKGLYQFIDQTWLATLKQAGPAYGYGAYADAISQAADGHYEVADPVQRAAIMRLRSDPAASAIMAGAFTQTNAAQLASALGRQPSEGELYIAHFLGPDGAAKMIANAASNPRANAADMFPQAAAANRSIFFDSAGHARSVADVYAKLTGRYEFARAAGFAPALRGTTAPEPTAPDTAGVTQAFAQANQSPVPAPQTGSLFQSMFTDRTGKAITQTVSDLWTPAGADAPAKSGQARPVSLFTDRPPEPRKTPGGKT
jgi:hypothetical protein